MERKDVWSTKWEVPTLSAKEGIRRHRRIRELMELRGIDCLIIVGNLNNYKAAAADIRYVSNFCGWFDEQYLVFPLVGEPLLFAWSPGHVYWGEKISWVPLKVVSMNERNRSRNWARDISLRIKELGLERANLAISNTRLMPLDIYWSVKRELPEANFVSAEGLLRQCRMTKSQEEIEFVRKAGECADRGIQALIKTAKPGATEYDLAAECECAMVKAGAELGNFILVSSGPWEKRQSSIPIAGSQRKLRKGDVILNEVTANYAGYFAQICRPICLGKPPADFLKLYEIHQEMYELCFAEMRLGNSIGEIESKAKNLAQRRGRFSSTFVFQTTELAETSIRYMGELQTGMVFVIHPWTVPDSIRKFSGHTIGDTCIVGKTEPECISKLPSDVTVVSG